MRIGDQFSQPLPKQLSLW